MLLVDCNATADGPNLNPGSSTHTTPEALQRIYASQDAVSTHVSNRLTVMLGAVHGRRNYIQSQAGSWQEVKEIFAHAPMIPCTKLIGSNL